jgi:predicted nucleic acid-binding protein
VEKIIIDTSAIYALLDKSDNLHQRSFNLFQELSTKPITVVITNFILAECHALLTNRLSPEWLRGLCWPVERVTEEDEQRAKEIIFTYIDKSFSYSDATTFAVMERLGINEVLAFDQHFPQYGFIPYRTNA